MPYTTGVLLEWTFVWAGGAVFVGSLAFAAFSYFLCWSGADGGGWAAAAADGLLVSGFAVHHSLFAREWVKRWLDQAIPERLLRSVYVWTASLLLVATCAAWRPIGHDFFNNSGVRRWLHAAIQVLGVLLIARTVRGLDPLELAGIRQAAAAGHKSLRGGELKSGEPRIDDGRAEDARLTIDGPYRLVRHPLYLGWILLVFGAAHMTGDRLAFAVFTTVYLLIAIPWEERSLLLSFGDEYRRYQQLVRWRVIPFIY